MHRRCLDLARREEPDLAGLVARGEPAAPDPAGEAEGKLLADLAVPVLDDMAGIGVHADGPLRLDVEAGLRPDLPDGRLRDTLANLHRATGHLPQAAVPAALQQDRSLVIHHDRRGGRDEVVDRRSPRIVVMVDAPHAHGFHGCEMAHTASTCAAKRSKIPPLPSRRRWSTGAQEPGVPCRCGVTNISSSKRKTLLYSGAAYTRTSMPSQSSTPRKRRSGRSGPFDSCDRMRPPDRHGRPDSRAREEHGCRYVLPTGQWQGGSPGEGTADHQPAPTKRGTRVPLREA